MTTAPMTTAPMTTAPMTTAREAADETADAEDVLLTGQRVSVTLAGAEPYVITTTNADRVRFDLTRPKHKWPVPQEAPFLWFTFLAWAASRREGRTALTFETFADQTIDVEAIDVDEDVDGVRPTRSGRG